MIETDLQKGIIRMKEKEIDRNKSELFEDESLIHNLRSVLN